MYYTRELPFAPGEAARLVGARTRDEKAAVESVLAEFFKDGHQVRCDREIERYQAKVEHNQRVGKLGGRPKKTETQTEPKDNPPGYFREPEPNPPSLQSPNTIKDIAPTELPAPALRAVPVAPPAFDGDNAKAIPSKAVVPLSSRFELPEEWGVDAEALGFPRSKVLFENERFRQYWTAGKGMSKLKSLRGWRQSWSNWLGKAAERAA